MNYIFRLAKSRDDKKAIWEVKKNISLEVFKDKISNIPELPWGINATRSVPVFFEKIEHLSLCFFKKENSRHFCKSPLYLGSMLEVNAVWQELYEGTALSRNDETWVVEKKFLAEEFSRFVYDSRLPEYHSLAHFVALQKGEPDILTTYRLASAISTFILMMPDDFLYKSVEKCVFELQKDARYSDVIRLNREWPREFLYYFIVTKLHKINNYDDVNEIFSLLPFWWSVRDNYFDLAYAGYCNKLKTMAAEFGGYFESIANALQSNAQSLMGQKSLNPFLLMLKKPPIYLNDGTIPGDSAFSGYEDYFMSIPDAEMAMAIKIGNQ
ncbi:hypothetical protein [Chromobacterium sp. Panama]|uniref:hypothetical protein n=1 Tax=Chromobacterium sp. Panama TaxID=2161826 RepID=UPI0011B28BDC|nr:hypothetical protein [Chromobacterium sp. Panama]